MWVNHICRLCAEINDYSLPIFEKDGDKNQLESKIIKCTSIQVNENDGKPTNICYNCYNKIEELNSFIDQCQSSDYKFDSILYNVKQGNQTTTIGSKIILEKKGYTDIQSINNSQIKSFTDKNQQVTEFIIEGKIEQGDFLIVQDIGSDKNQNTVKQKEPKKKKKIKRPRNPENWKCNIRKKLHEQGLEYVNVRKKIVPAKQITDLKDCVNKCIFRCSKIITNEERQYIFKHYYKLSKNDKRNFIISTSNRLYPERRRTKMKNENCIEEDNQIWKKKFTYQYFFDINGNRVQVCKPFYLGTLSISQRQIYSAHDKLWNSSYVKMDTKDDSQS